MRYVRSTRRREVTKAAQISSPTSLTTVDDAVPHIDEANVVSPLPSHMSSWFNLPLRKLFKENHPWGRLPASPLLSPQAEDPELTQYISLRTSIPAPDSHPGLRLLLRVVLCETCCSKPEERRRLLEGYERHDYGTL